MKNFKFSYLWTALAGFAACASLKYFIEGNLFGGFLNLFICFGNTMMALIMAENT